MATNSFWRNPAWQAAGVIVAVASIIIGAWISYDISRSSENLLKEDRSLLITSDMSGNLVSPTLNSVDSISVLLAGEPIQGVRVINYSITNDGNIPIRPEDFHRPLTIRIDSALQFVSSVIESQEPESLGPEWVVVDSATYKLSPILLNPRDNIRGYFLVYTTSDASGFEGPVWDARVFSISRLNVSSESERFAELLSTSEGSGSGFFSFSIRMSGLNVILFFVLSVLLSLLPVILFYSIGLIERPSYKMFLVIILFAPLCLHVADTILWEVAGAYVGSPSSYIYLYVWIYVSLVAIIALIKVVQSVRTRSADAS